MGQARAAMVVVPDALELEPDTTEIGVGDEEEDGGHGICLGMDLSSRNQQSRQTPNMMVVQVEVDLVPIFSSIRALCSLRNNNCNQLGLKLLYNGA